RAGGGPTAGRAVVPGAGRGARRRTPVGRGVHRAGLRAGRGPGTGRGGTGARRRAGPGGLAGVRPLGARRAGGGRAGRGGGVGAGERAGVGGASGAAAAVPAPAGVEPKRAESAPPVDAEGPPAIVATDRAWRDPGSACDTATSAATMATALSPTSSARGDTR